MVGMGLTGSSYFSHSPFTIHHSQFRSAMPKAQLQSLADELSKLREQKLYQKLRILETEQLPVANFDGQEVINLSSNNYLGLTTHPELKEAAVRAVEEFGVGSGAVRAIAGTMTLHMELEAKIAKFKQVEASV